MFEPGKNCLVFVSQVQIRSFPEFRFFHLSPDSAQPCQHRVLPLRRLAQPCMVGWAYGEGALGSVLLHHKPPFLPLLSLQWSKRAPFLRTTEELTKSVERQHLLAVEEACSTTWATDTYCCLSAHLLRWTRKSSRAEWVSRGSSLSRGILVIASFHI